MRPERPRPWYFPSLLTFLLLAACGSSGGNAGEGEPCQRSTDCAPGLFCDFQSSQCFDPEKLPDAPPSPEPDAPDVDAPGVDAPGADASVDAMQPDATVDAML